MWRWLIAVFLSLVSIAATASPLPERANYFAGGFAPAFAELRGFLGLIRTCRERFTASCGRSVDEQVPGLASMVEVVPLVTAIGTTTRAATDMPVDEASLAERMLAAKDSFNRELLSFDKDLLQRYWALLSVCPYRNGDIAPPQLDLTFRRYWRLSVQDYQQLRKEIQRAAHESAQEIRKWPRERCVAARNFGDVILHSLTVRLRPYAEAGWEKISVNERFDQAMAAVLAVAVTFEETVHPDAMKEIEARMIAFEKKNKSSVAAP